ncbi:MAG TPA: FAD-dependent oxidoreductase [Thermoanaerobacterales bacterium]|jgi:NADH dehydrogenase|nr:FAD-dependent oxidoreductase [Thermoanaerobacterales bacterium]
MDSKKKIVVLGGGFGGLTAAQALDKFLRKNKNVEITLINKSPNQIYLTQLHEVAGNRIPEDGTLYSLESALDQTRVKLVVDEISKVDVKARKLYGVDNEYTFDYLILACGSEPAFFDIPGMKENAFTLWSHEDALRIRDHIVNMFKIASTEKDVTKRKDLLTFVVGGGGFTGIEMIGELVEWVEDLCIDYNIKRNEVSLMVVEALPKILPTMSDSLIENATNYLKKKGVRILTSSCIANVSSDSFTLESGETINTQTLIWTGGVQANATVADIDLKVGKRNRILVSKYMETSEPGIYAIGDNCCYTDKAGNVMPALVESAIQSAKCAAYNISAEINNRPKKPLNLKLHGNMVSIGAEYCVAEVMGLKLKGFLASGAKHLADIHYLFGVSGFGFILDYIDRQFFRKTRNKPMVVKHIGVSTSAAWLALLRIFLGYKWLMSGLEKVNAGWLSTGDKLVAGASTAPIGPNTPEWYVQFMEKVVFPNALLFQAMITLGEIALGICFILGLFTVLAALGSIFMNLNFIISGSGDMWFLVVSIAMLAGAGRSFGLDYYVIPYASKVLKRLIRRSQMNLT